MDLNVHDMANLTVLHANMRSLDMVNLFSCCPLLSDVWVMATHLKGKDEQIWASKSVKKLSIGVDYFDSWASISIDCPNLASLDFMRGDWAKSLQIRSSELRSLRISCANLARLEYDTHHISYLELGQCLLQELKCGSTLTRLKIELAMLSAVTWEKLMAQFDGLEQLHLILAGAESHAKLKLKFPNIERIFIEGQGVFLQQVSVECPALKSFSCTNLKCTVLAWDGVPDVSQLTYYHTTPDHAEHHRTAQYTTA